MLVIFIQTSQKSMGVTEVLGWIFIVLAILPQPVGNFLVKKSFEDEGTAQHNKNVRRFGNLLLIAVSPGLHILAYMYGENAFIAPILSCAVLVNIALSWKCLKEGKEMNAFTAGGVLLFAIGLFSILLTYSKLLSGENVVNLDQSVDWGAFSIYLGVWVWALTILTCVALFSRAKALVVWSVFAAVLGSLDVVATYDKWIFNNEMNSASERTKGVLATALYIVSSVLSIYIVNVLLASKDNPVHIVSAILSITNLVFDVSGDLFIYQRYLVWEEDDWVLSVAGLALMVVGIWIMNIRFAGKQKDITPIVTPTPVNNTEPPCECPQDAAPIEIHEQQTFIIKRTPSIYYSC